LSRRSTWHLTWLVLGLTVCLSSAAGRCSADIVADILTLQASKPHSYDQFISATRELAGSDRITAEKIGYTGKGRAVILLAVHHPEHRDLPPSEHPPCLFIIARQHGTEAAGTEAALALLRYFATTRDEVSLRILRQLTIVTVPMANPDGVAAGRRSNSANVDLNRDWLALSQPETTTIAAAVERWQPLAVIDMHELPASSPRPAFARSFVQTIGYDLTVPQWISADCHTCTLRIADWMRRYSLPANFYYDQSNRTRTLCHRYFGLVRGIPAFLFESSTGPGHPLHERVAFHVLGTLVVGNHLIHSYYNKTTPTRTPAMVVSAPPQVSSADSSTAPPTTQPQMTAPSMPLELQILKPDDGATVAGMVPIVAQVAGTAFSYITFSVDGALKAMSTSTPYTYALDTEDYADGKHHIEVSLCSDIGQPVLSKACTLTVNNSPMGR